MAEICVIIPVYNVEAYLHRCVDSVLMQTFTDFDLVLVDDGSPDRCGLICDEYAKSDARIHVIHQKNGGLSAARNAGIKWSFFNSDSIWLSFIDSDDWVHPYYFEALLSSANEYKLDIAISRFLRLHDGDLPKFTDWNATTCKTEEFYLKDCVNATVSWGKLIKKRYYKDILFPVGKIHEDEFTTYRILFQQYRVVVVEQPLYAYFQNENGIMLGKWKPGRLDGLEAQEQQIEFFLSKGFQNIAKGRFQSFIRNAMSNQDNIKKCDELTNFEKKKYIIAVKERLRRILIRYRKYHWLPFQQSEANKRVYMNAFSGIRILRNVWGKVKSALKKFFITHFLGHQIKQVWRRRPDIKIILHYIWMLPFYKTVLLQSPFHGNLGDQAITEAELTVMKKLQFTCLEFPFSKGIEKYCSIVTPNNRLILHHGGGNLGQLWPEEENRFRKSVSTFCKNQIIVFPQTVFFDLTTEEGFKCFVDSKTVYESHPNLTIFLREKYSYDFMRQYMPKVHVELVPDMVMTLDWKQKDINRQGVLLCMRKDKEKTISDENYERLVCHLSDEYIKVLITDTVIPGNIDIQQREKIVHDKLTEFASASLVVTDRLHGMIFAAITETPCIILDSLSHKIRGCYEWLKDLDYIRFVDAIEDVPITIQALQKVKPMYNRDYIEKAMEPLYTAIRKSIR